MTDMNARWRRGSGRRVTVISVGGRTPGSEEMARRFRRTPLEPATSEDEAPPSARDIAATFAKDAGARGPELRSKPSTMSDVVRGITAAMRQRTAEEIEAARSWRVYNERTDRRG